MSVSRGINIGTLDVLFEPGFTGLATGKDPQKVPKGFRGFTGDFTTLNQVPPNQELDIGLLKDFHTVAAPLRIFVVGLDTTQGLYQSQFSSSSKFKSIS
jgi:hypothetical protein